MHVVQQDDEAHEHHGEHAHERVVDERVEEHQNEAPADDDAGAAQRAEEATLALLERPLQHVDHGLRFRSERQRHVRSPAAQPQSKRDPVHKEGKRQEACAEELLQRYETVFQESGPDQQDHAERTYTQQYVDDDGVLPAAVTRDRALDEEHVLVSNWYTVEQCKRRRRQLLICEKKR